MSEKCEKYTTVTEVYSPLKDKEDGEVRSSLTNGESEKYEE